jgi:SAM-dependent methyltransferase
METACSLTQSIFVLLHVLRGTLSMPEYKLNPNNWRKWPPEFFDREDPAPDEQFYDEPRKVVHLDLYAIQAVTDLYRELLPPGGVILDLMSSWRSHLPTELKFSRVVGLGLNAEELADNPDLTEAMVHNLNRDQALPFEAETFDAAICAVSIQYLTRPVETFREVARVLKPGAPFIVTFSNRRFPTKAIRLWLSTDDQAHLQIVALYFTASGEFEGVIYQDRSPGAQFDPLYAVWGFKRKMRGA